MGDLDDGVNIKKAKELLNVVALTENECKECWAFYLYNSCLISSIVENGLSRVEQLNYCEKVKMHVY